MAVESNVLFSITEYTYILEVIHKTLPLFFFNTKNQLAVGLASRKMKIRVMTRP